MKKLLYIYLLLVALVSKAQTNDTIKVYTYKDFITNNKYYKTLNGWKFTQGNNDLWKNLDYNDSNWATIKADTTGKVVEKEIIFNKLGWFRKTIKIDSTLVGVPLSFNLELGGAYTIYLNGVPLKTFGKFSTKNSKSVNYKYDMFNEQYITFTFKKPGKQVFAIKYENPEITKTSNFFGFKFNISTIENAIDENNSKNQAVTGLAVFASILITLSVFHLILYLFYREFKPNLFFSLFSFSMGGAFISFILVFKASYLLDNNIIEKLIVFLVCLSGFALSGLINTLFSSKQLRFKIYSVLCIVALLILLFSIEISGGFIVPLLFIFACIEATILLIKAILKKVKGAKILATGILLTLFFLVLIIVSVLIFIENGHVKFGNGQNTATNIFMGIIFIGFILSFFSIPFSMSAYLAWYFSYINEENESKLIEIENLTQESLQQEKEKQTTIENINQELESQVINRKNEIEIQKSEIKIQNEKLKEERLKSDTLLLNILPEEIALELKEKGKSQSKFFDSVTILFTDFKDFTKLTEKVSSTELIEELNYCFKEFDRIISKYGIEKIKTIGDAYMAVSGLPVKDENHAIKMVHAALEIRDFMEQYKQKRINEGKEYFEMRIGINSGEVVAGIVGIKKFTYDVWGIAVNIAAEMEVNGAIGKVNISQNTYQLVKEIFTTELRSEKLMDSQLNMYFVENKEPNLRFLEVKKFIIEKQLNELPKHLHYHNLNHILDVHEAVIRYAKLEGVTTKDTELLQVAALFHDSGFIVKGNGHEEISCTFADTYLPEFGYSAIEIEKIKGMIRATKIPQTPKNHLEQILADADLDYLGRNDFEEIANGLYEEILVENKDLNKEKWNNIQVSFFENHKYFTESAKRLRNNKKEENLTLIKSQKN